MKMKNTTLVVLATIALLGATVSATFADETTDTGSVTGTGITDSGSTNSGSGVVTTNSGSTDDNSSTINTNSGSTNSGSGVVTTNSGSTDDNSSTINTNSGSDISQSGVTLPTMGYNIQQINEYCGDLSDQNKTNRDQIRVNWDTFRMDYGKLGNYLKRPLSVDERTAITALVKTHNNERTAILSGAGSNTDKLAALKTSLTTFLSGIETYVATDKVAAYNTFITARLAIFDSNNTLGINSQTNAAACRVARAQIKVKAQRIKRVLSNRFRNLLNSRLNAIPTYMKQAFYQKLINRLDVFISQPRTQRVKDMLLEIRAIVRVRLDAVISGGSESRILNEVFAQ